MDLQIIDKRIDTRPLADRLTQGESNADECVIVSERFYGAIDLASLTWEIRGTVRDRNLSMSQVLTPEDSEDQLRLPWKIGPEFLMASGTLRLTLVGSGANGDVIVKFNGDKLYIKPNDLSGFAPSTSPIEKMWAQMVVALETAKECAQQTASDAEAAKASEKSAASSAAAALASEQSSATSKQAAESAAKEAKEAAQEAVGFRTMQGGVVLPIDGDIDLTQPYPTKTGGSLTVTSAANRIDSVTINGFTTQTGSGDASPANVRTIKNAGKEFVKVVFDGSSDESWKYLTGTGHPYFSGTFPNFAVYGTGAYSTHYKLGNVLGANDVQGFSVFEATLTVRDYNIQSLEDFKAKLSANPLTVIYTPQDASNATGVYTFVEVEQGDSYHCDIVELKDRLHSGDKLDVNMVSEYDAVSALTGDETYKTYDGWVPGSVEVHNVVADSIKVTGYATKANILCNQLPIDTPEQITSKSNVRPAIGQGGNYGNIVFLYLGPKYNTMDLAKQRIKELHDAGTPIKLFYKKEIKGESFRIKRESHAKKTYVFTGTEAITSGTAASKTYFALPGINVKAPSTMSEVGSVKCNMLATFAQNNVANGDYRICNSTGGNFLFHFTDDITTVEQAKQILAEKFAAGTPFVIEYELKALDVFADTPIIVNNPQGTYTVSGESGTTCQAQMKRLQDGGNATTLSGHSWDDIVSLISEMINSKGE